MAEPATASKGEAQHRFLTFRSGGRLYALPAETVAEVIRMPAVARVPQGPVGLLGVANLRGAIMPVASLPALLGQDEAVGFSRAIVLAGTAPAALAVEAVEALVGIDADAVQYDPAQLAAEPGERLAGAFSVSADRAAKILDIQPLLAQAFTPRQRAPRLAHRTATMAVDEAIGDDRQKLLSFDVAGQEFALRLEVVIEIMPAPIGLAVLPRADAVVLGLIGYRDGLLPLLSLRGLLGFSAGAADGGKVVVTTVGGRPVGLLVDRMRDIVPADPRRLETVSKVLAARTGGESQVTAIYRVEGGGRLISVLSPEQLFAEDVMARLGEAQAIDGDAEVSGGGEERRLLVFRLGDDEFGLPIESVDEVAAAPEQVTRVPKTPDFLEGVINLRGDVLPVIDQRKRFAMPPLDGGRGKRLVVVRTERHRAGLIVDSVSEVLRIDVSAIAEPPSLTGEADRLVDGVINLEAAGRIVLRLDPSELLTRAERGLLDKFSAARDGS